MVITYVEGDPTGFSQEEFMNVRLCLETLVSIPAGTQPMDRELGLDYDGIIGYPIPTAENMLALEVSEKVAKYEPRAAIKKLELTSDGSQITVHIYFVKAEVA